MLQKTLKVIVLLFVTQVNSLDTFLRAQSVLYGLSSLTETIDRNTTCLREFYKLYEEVDLKHYWALKGNIFLLYQLRYFTFYNQKL